MRISRFFTYFLISLGTIWVAVNLPSSFFRPTHQIIRWSIPQTIPGYNPNSAPPILIADQNRTVHAFSSQWLESDDNTSKPSKAIMYNQWTYESGWTKPVDILLSPIKEARVTDAFIDSDGIIHLIFFGGDGEAANIYYSQAPVSAAYSAWAWSNPIVIGEGAKDPENAVLVKGKQGDLIVVYYGEKDGTGIYITKSDDNGNNWSEPNPFFLATSENPNIGLISVIASESGWVHAIWGVYNIGGQGRGIYYARSENADDWSIPTLLEGAQNDLGTQTPAIIEYKDTLFAFYNQTPKIMMRRSSDNGVTWKDPVIMFPRHIGVNGTLSPVIDGAENLHIFFGQRISGDPDIHGMWHSEWNNDRWTEPDAVISGPQVTDLDGNNSFDPYDANAIVSQGNVILVTWRTDPGLKGNGVWFSSKLLDIPELPIITPEPEVLQTGEVITTTNITETQIDKVTLENTQDLPATSLDLSSSPRETSISTIIIYGIAPVLMLILTIIVWRIVQVRKN
jgi:hypothetical protein